MGGFGSTRWGDTLTRVSTENLPRLDVRALVRAGGLEPGSTTTVTWRDGASIMIHVLPGAPDSLALRYTTHTGTGQWLQVADRIAVTRTVCHFGGTREWFACPTCGLRCAVLYALLGRFRCRRCHHLAYASTRRHARLSRNDERLADSCTWHLIHTWLFSHRMRHSCTAGGAPARTGKDLYRLDVVKRLDVAACVNDGSLLCSDTEPLHRLSIWQRCQEMCR